MQIMLHKCQSKKKHQNKNILHSRNIKNITFNYYVIFINTINSQATYFKVYFFKTKRGIVGKAHKIITLPSAKPYFDKGKCFFEVKNL